MFLNILNKSLYKLRAGGDYRQISVAILRELDRRGLVKAVWVEELEFKNEHPLYCKVNSNGIKYLEYLEKKGIAIL